MKELMSAMICFIVGIYVWTFMLLRWSHVLSSKYVVVYKEKGIDWILGCCVKFGCVVMWCTKIKALIGFLIVV